MTLTQVLRVSYAIRRPIVTIATGRSRAEGSGAKRAVAVRTEFLGLGPEVEYRDIGSRPGLTSTSTT